MILSRFKGFGAPSCAKILTWWFATFERGTYWVRSLTFVTRFIVYECALSHFVLPRFIFPGYVEHRAQSRRLSCTNHCEYTRACMNCRRRQHLKVAKAYNLVFAGWNSRKFFRMAVGNSRTRVAGNFCRNLSSPRHSGQATRCRVSCR